MIELLGLHGPRAKFHVPLRCSPERGYRSIPTASGIEPHRPVTKLNVKTSVMFEKTGDAEMRT